MLAIDARGLSLVFTTRDGPVQALSDIHLAVAPGEFVSLIGPSGCGKTSLLRVIADLESPTGGIVSASLVGALSLAERLVVRRMGTPA